MRTAIGTFMVWAGCLAVLCAIYALTRPESRPWPDEQPGPDAPMLSASDETIELNFESGVVFDVDDGEWAQTFAEGVTIMRDGKVVGHEP